MEANEQLKQWINNYYNKLLEQLVSLDNGEKYYLSSDEGGMLGNPRFSISTTELEKPYFEPIGYLTKNHIKNYILGRMVTWKLDSGDYSNVTQIIIE